MKYVLIALAFALAACAGQEGPRGADGATVTITTPVRSAIDEAVSMENAYRDSVGLTPLTSGLSCTLYTVPSSTATIVGASLTTVATYTYRGVFNQPNSPASSGLNILPTALQPLYTSFFVVKCRGNIVATINDYQQFTLASDDGSVLYIDGTMVINNDGNHGVVTKSAMKYLRYGVHSFELDYMEGPAGNQALVLNMNASIIPANILYH